MAEFKLGRIRFVWKGNWSAATAYYKDDVVRHGGRTYLCVIGHTSDADFDTDLQNVPTRWNKVSDGQDWKGDWTTGTVYKINDIVKYGGYLYICNEGHTSAATATLGLEANSADWDLYAEGFDYKTDWATSTRYKINDIVKYGGNTYICNLGHTSAATAALGLEADSAKWNVYSEGFDWKGAWITNTRYKLNDVVKYGGITYLCITGHTSAATATLGLENNSGNWEVMHAGTDYKGTWDNNSVRYKLNDLVKYGAGVYICTAHHTSSTGTTFEAEETAGRWAQYVEGLEFDDNWNSSTIYQPGDVVRYGGYVYVAKTNHSNSVPPDNGADWDLFNTGFKLIGDWSSVTDYKVGDVVRLNGYTYVAVAGNTNQKPPNLAYWDRLNSGFRWQGAWSNGVDYVLGDVVRFTPGGGQPSSYVCILAHTSNTGTNRPDIDGGNNWNLLVAGAEDTNLTTVGDLLYYGGSGPTRLPIGDDGQILKSNGTLPVWDYWGVIQKVFYVSTVEGVDSPAPTYGITLDKPWKTVRYAAEQVEKGTENPNAAYLLKLNRTFIQEEIIAWTDAQIAGDIAPFDIGFTYDQVFCKRDMGLIVDALIYDITHSGNTKSRAAALAYFDGSGSYITGQEAETVASINYGLSVIQNVLANTSPVVNYSSWNQFIDVTYTAETGTFDTVSSLVEIITDAITAGDTDDVPAIRQPQYTIFVKTGRYEEVLPIIVPAYTAIVGDELRSTKIVPAGAVIPASDKDKTIEALVHLRSITEDIITNTPVTPTTDSTFGNAETQVTSLTAGSVGYSAYVTAVEAKMNEIIDILENGSGAADAFTFPNPTGYNTSYLIGYGDARDQLDANRAFIIDEITSWIAFQVTNGIAPFATTFTYDSAACARDVGYLLDALKYDLTYGGNTQTLVAARAYFSYGNPTYGFGEKEETLASYEHLQDVVGYVIDENTSWTKRTALTQDTSGTAGSAASKTFAQARIQDTIDTITNNGTLPTEILPGTSWVAASLVTARNRFIDIKDDLRADAVAWVRYNYPTLVFNETTCSRDVGYILDAVGYDLMFGSNFASIKAALAYYRGTASAQLFLATQKAATVGMLTYLRIQLTKYVANGAAVVADILWSYIIGYLTTLNRPPTMGTNRAELDTEIYNGALILIANKEFLAQEAVAYIQFQHPSYDFDGEACARDVREFIEAIAYDIIYNGNYKVILATRYYVNAYVGSKLEDMFYVRNACGLRNCTLDELDGSSDGNTTGIQSPLTNANANGTQRVRGGAYVSLDPGWGPNDTRVWTNERSTYVQNVTTFGIGAIGQKIDGNIHRGGNRSIVSNDFTQVISDGIGAYVTNNGLAELVSVFTYYAHIGYIAENGGKIRATNGNCSYGDYGAVSEGADVTETPILGKIDNRASEADVRNVYTNANQILRFEYRDAGINYSQATFSISGAGGNAVAVGDEIRDDGVHNIRLTDPGDSSGIGGSGYVTAANLAQGGTTTQITLAATDVAGNSAYPGMAIYIIAGTGAGQYAYINTYNAGSKVATVLKESTGTAGWDHVIAGTPIAAALDVTSSYVISPRLTFTDPPFTSSLTNAIPNREWTSVVYGAADGSYTNVASTTSGSGVAATFDVVRRDGSYTVTLNGPGTLYQVNDILTISGASLGGTTPANDVLITVTNISENAVSGPIIGFTHIGTAIAGQFVAVANNTDVAASSTDGITWTSRTMPSSQEWSSVTYGTIGGNGYWIAVAQNGTTAAYSTNGTTWTATGVLPASADWSSVGYGNERFVAVSTGGSGSAYSTNGITWTAMTGLSSQNWSDVVYGAGRWVAVAQNTDAYAYSTNGTSWSLGTMPSAQDWTSVAFGNNRFVAVSKGNDSDLQDSDVSAFSLNGLSWTAVTLPKADAWLSINYSQGVFFAVSPSKSAVSSPDGVIWTERNINTADIEITATSKDLIGTFTNRTLSATAYWTDMLFDGDTFWAVGNNQVDTGYISSSTNLGDTWSAATVSSASGYEFVAIAYNGSNKYVVLIFNDRDIITSTDGVTWTVQNSNGVNNLPAARTWTDLTYGDKFVAIANVGTNPVFYSSDATTWTQGTLATAAWSAITYGLISTTGYYVAVASGSQNAAYSTDGITWTSGATLPSSDAWSSIAYHNGTFVTVAGDSGTSTTKAAYSTNATSWTAATLPGAAANWTKVVYGGGVFMAFAYASTRTAVSTDGITWVEGPAISSGLWNTAAYGSTAVDNGKFVAARTNSSSVAANITYKLDTNFITTTSTSNLSLGDIIEFESDVFGGIAANTIYFVKSIPNATSFVISETLGGSDFVLSTGSGIADAQVSKYYVATAAGNPNGNNVWVALARANTGVSALGSARSTNVYQGTRTVARSYVSDNELQEIWIVEPGSNYSSPPTMVITDPNNTGADATFVVRLGNGVLANPTFTNRGAGYTAATATLIGDGSADRYQEGTIISVKDLDDIPIPGANLQIIGIDDVYYRIVTVTNLTGVGPYSAIFQVSPIIGNLEAPEHETNIVIRKRYSQVRLTGHDFLSIGTGNKTQTNYPGLPFQDPIPANETVDIEGGRVFYTSTDQDGNFRVGGLFNVEQATGIATLNADAFNIAGLQELQLGSVALGGSGATITEFSTDPFFTADSDNIVPTQRAIKAYITSQIGGGQSSINVNTLTAGIVFISTNSITTTTGAQININTKVNFTGGVSGTPVALNYFLR
jgi:hypothetical protein